MSCLFEVLNLKVALFSQRLPFKVFKGLIGTN